MTSELESADNSLFPISQVRSEPSSLPSIFTTLRASPNLQLIKWILHVEIQPASNDVSPRANSMKLSMALQPDLRGPVYDDMTIAEGLLNNSKVPRRTSSFTGTLGLARSTSQTRGFAPFTDASAHGMSRRAGRTSNTWTESDGEILSDHDEVDDRTVFVQEFNRLAKKVIANRLR
jgi:hypothetical protein